MCKKIFIVENNDIRMKILKINRLLDGFTIDKMEISNDFYQFRAKNGKEKLSRPIVFLGFLSRGEVAHRVVLSTHR